MKKLLSLFLILSLLLAGCGVIPPAETLRPSLDPDSTGGNILTVHYIDVGQADCALLEHDGNYILIDGGNVDDSSLVVSYLEDLGVTYLNLVICTHAHEDHAGGLGGVLAVFETGAVWSPTRTYASKCFDTFMKYADQQGLEVTIPSPGDEFTAGQLKLTVLGPVKDYADPNNTSIVVMAQFLENKFLFTGDMEKEAETDMLDYWESRVDWNCDVLKVGHHGSTTSSGYRFVYEADPEYAVISVGANNSYGHPHDEVVKLYRDAEIPMFRTDELGHITVTSDGYNLTVTWQDQSAQPEAVQPAETTYIGNKNSKKFHSPSCSSLPKEENRIIFQSYQEAIAVDYSPCGSCLG